MKKIAQFLCFGLCLVFPLSAQTKLEKEYEACLQRLLYAKQCGFIYDGINKIEERREVGSEYSFYTENKNIFVKVIDPKTKKEYFTHCFDFTDVGGYLGIKTYRLAQEIALDGDYWNLFKASKLVNITVCTATTCKNTQIQLYEINAPILSVTDGILYTFAKGTEKIVSQLDFKIKYKGIPDIDISKEKETVASLTMRIKQTFSADKANSMVAKLEEALSLAE